MLEFFGFYFGRLLKIGEHNENQMRVKFSRICVEIDLSQPLKKGFWVESSAGKVMLATSMRGCPSFDTCVVGLAVVRSIVVLLPVARHVIRSSKPILTFQN